MGQITFKGRTGTIQFKGQTGTIQFKNLGKVANPTLSVFWSYDGASSKWFKAVTVRNHDTETVSAYAGLQSYSLTSKGTLDGGDYDTYILSVGYDYGMYDPKPSFSAYAQMKAESRTDSDIIEGEYINPNKIASPTVEAKWGVVTDPAMGWTRLVTVTNTDIDTVSVYVDTSSTPTTLRGTLNPGDSSTYQVGVPLHTQPPAGHTFTAYVQLKRDGRPNSDIISETGVYQKLL